MHLKNIQISCEPGNLHEENQEYTVHGFPVLQTYYYYYWVNFIFMQNLYLSRTSVYNKFPSDFHTFVVFKTID
jgi:hypothetical protein